MAEKRATASGNRIVSIDLGQVGSNVIDLSSDAARMANLGHPMARNFARSSAEVLIEGNVPAAAVRLLPRGA